MHVIDDSGPGELNEVRKKPDWWLEGQTTRLEFSSKSCALQRRLHDAKAGDPAPYGSTGYVVDHDRFVYKPHSCSVDNRL